ncbi:MAG: PH domain-containing protein [Verrucomicrobia bacterium]|nr:PH domain-containing protein [Verrucomicrobiota bacterium]
MPFEPEPPRLPPLNAPDVPPVIGAVPPPLPPDSDAKRLHPMTLFFAGWGVVRGWLIPIVIFLFVGRYELLTFLAFMAGLQIVFSVVRYFTFTYRIAGAELITREGLIQRHERNIPLDRVQDIKIEQGVLHRMLKMAVVQVETAGGKGAEATLSVLSQPDAEQLRRLIFERRAIVRGKGAETTEPQPEQPAEIIRKLELKDLVMAGLTSNRMASVIVLLGAVWAFADDVLGEKAYIRMQQAIEQWFAQLATYDLQTTIFLFIFGAIGIILFSMIISVIGSVVLFHGFTLVRHGEDLQRSYGLLTRRTASLPRRRIQVLQIQEGILRRLFGLAAVRADTAGSPAGDGQQSGHDSLLPIIPKDELGTLMPVFFPNFDNEQPDWRRVSRVAIRRGTLKGSLLLLTLSAILSFFYGQASLWALIFLPAVYLINVLNYRHLGYSLGAEYFQTRRGWLKRSTHVVPIRNIQSVVLHQNPFDRRHRVATLIVDTAGQTYTGGGPRISNVAMKDAVHLARLLSQQASQRRLQW